MKISDLLQFSASREPGATALVFDDRQLSYQQLYEQVCRLANGLRRIAEPGDRVAILSENCIEYVLAYYGVPLAGMGLVFLNYRLSAREVADILDDSRPTVLITEQAYLETSRTASAGVESIHTMVCVDGSDGGAAGTVPFASLFEGSPTTEPDTSDESLAWLLYTSGTTGKAKGAALSHRNVTTAVCNSAISWDSSEPGPVRSLFPWPLCHIAGYAVLVSHLQAQTLVLMRRYDPEAFLALVQDKRITSITGAPTMLAMLLRHPAIDRYDTSSITRIGYGSAPMPAQVLREAMQRFPSAGFQTGFGMTELGGNVMIHSMADHVAAAQGRTELLESIGKPMALSAVRIVDDDGNDVARNEVGELVVRGEQVLTHYWNRPDATEEALRDGWLHTGDMARCDDAGYFYIVDRKKDMVLSGGENVYSREVEEVLHQHSAVGAAAVVGQPDELWGELVVAVVEPRAGEEPAERDIIEFCTGRLARYKCPRRVMLVDELPRNTVGKVLKRELRAQLGAGAAPAPTPAAPSVDSGSAQS
ncbi:MAG: AMP-binding protein [Pseudonocardiaceae bacterium]|nr:AMP-binding protein [Pseudonocardiaceae bacterium]